jgi:hypothetical protein
MVVPNTMADLERVGVVFAIDHDALVYDAPEGAMTPERLAALRESRPALRLLLELRQGQQWLTRQHQLWVAKDPNAADDETFSRVLNQWCAKDYMLRRLYGWQDCIHGPGQRCPADGVADCRGCAEQYAAHTCRVLGP